MIRWTTIVLLLATLVGAAAYDRIDRASAPEPVGRTVPVVSPSIRSEPRDSEVWYCPVGSSIEEGFADHTVLVTNLGSDLMIADVRTATADGFGPSLRVEVAPNSTEPVRLSEVSSEVVAGAIVDLVGGHGVVGHQVTTDRGSPIGPCHSAVSEQWYFASGATSRDAHDYLVLLNPFENPVIFTATFQTSTRIRTPAELDRAVVPPKSARVIDVGNFVSREPVVATMIQTVQGGRLAVERLQTFDGELGPVGATLDLGVAAPANRWSFPAGRIVPGSDNTITVYNPSETVAEVDLSLDPLDPTDRATYGLIPIELSVQPGRLVTVDIADILAPYQLPPSYELGVSAVSTNQVPVVVGRWQLTPEIDTTLIGAGGDAAESEPGATDEGGADELDAAEISGLPVPDEALLPPAQPDPDVGVTSSVGQPDLAKRWAIPWIPLLDRERSVIVVSSPEGGLVEVQLVVGGELLPPVRSSVEPGGRTLVVLPPVAVEAAVVVSSDVPVSVAGLVADPGVDYQHIAAVPFVEG